MILVSYGFKRQMLTRTAHNAWSTQSGLDWNQQNENEIEP